MMLPLDTTWTLLQGISVTTAAAIGVWVLPWTENEWGRTVAALRGRNPEAVEPDDAPLRAESADDLLPAPRTTRAPPLAPARDARRRAHVRESVPRPMRPMAGRTTPRLG